MWFKLVKQQIELRIFAKPNAKKTALLKINKEGLHISLHATPHEGEANKELISYLASLIGIPKSHIILQRGKSSRYKVVLIPLTIKAQIFIDNLSSKQDT